MPLLGGLFLKRNSAQRHAPPSTATESVASEASNIDTTDGDYVLPDKPISHSPPVYDMPAASSSAKLKLPFRRKQPVASPDHKDTSHSVVSLNDAPSPPRISSVTSDSGHALPPPPRKSSLFAIYNDSHHSVQSLPNDPSHGHVHSDTPTRQSCSDVRAENHPPRAGQHQKKTPRLFSWARERTRSKPSPPLPSIPSLSPSTDDSSFNLKSFRHVRADPPAPSPEKSPQPSPNLLLPPAVPRPRGDSVASDSSQRISVAAFREAQARSRANSPVPSFRPPSTADTLRVDGNGRKRASTVSVISGPDLPQLNQNVTAAPMPSPRPESSADTSSDSESSEDDEEVDSDGEPIPKPVRKRTITRRVDGIRARSDAGHGSVTTSTDQAPHARKDLQSHSRSAPPPTYQPGQAPFTRTRASVSTSALTPSGAARRASILTAANSSSSSSHAPSRAPPRKPQEDSDESTDSEDMPLSDLVAPRRPGSSASNRSNNRPRMPIKPLIDINSLAGGPPLLSPILRHQNSVKTMKHQEQDIEKDQPFSIPTALALSSPLMTPSVSNENAMPVNRPISATYHRRSSDVAALSKSEAPDNDDDLMNAVRLVGALDKEQDPPSGTTKPSDRIVPTHIREREPPTSFTVLSRPAQRHSTAETLRSLSPVSQTHSSTTHSAVSQSEEGARPRAPTTIKSPAQNDRSDTASIASAARSSRSFSRIPPVPLIHSIPDSPSVKEEYKAGRPRSVSRTSAVMSSEARSPPPPVPALPSSASNKTRSHGFQSSQMPQRPFASDRSIRGESPAGSSTGDSSSGRAPFTPRDGSDIGTRTKDDNSDVGSTLKARGHAKKQSVTFEDEQPFRGRERAKTDPRGEERTRERRRSEAKAAIELGKIVNGREPLVHDDYDEDVGVRGRNPKINVTVESGMMAGWGAWQQPMGIPPQFGNDPTYLAAHQRALMIAKQAYQMAVAQQAMQMAGEEWERSSNIGFGSGGSVYGGGSGGSVYSGGGGGSVYGVGAGIAPMGMMGMPNLGMLMPPNQWARSSVAFPSTASVYGGISNSQSEFGGSGGWATRSVYGDTFGFSSSRASLVNVSPSGGTDASDGNSRPRARTGVSPPSALRPPGKPSVARSRAAPPSSWKNGR